jgi:CubicO group peptidase (beta-lactamase class C family)
MTFDGRGLRGRAASWFGGDSSPRSRHCELDGLHHPAFADVAEVLRSVLRHQGGGAAVCIYHRGQPVVDLWGGERDAKGAAWRTDTMAPSFSTTKGVASTLLHILRDRGLVAYDDCVATHWPEFAQAGKESITIRQVMSHQSGLYHIRQMIDHADRMLDWDHMVAAIERTKPAHPPGERTGYHGLTYGFIVGEIARRVTGREFSDLVHDEIAEPLGLDGLYIGAPEEALARAAQLVWAGRRVSVDAKKMENNLGGAIENAAVGMRRALRAIGVPLDPGSILDALAPRGISSFDFGGPESLRVAIPAANGLFTARSLARMYAALAGGGELDGTRLMSRETLRLASERQKVPHHRAVIPFEMGWRLGYHGVYTTRGVPRNGFGHFGFGGSGAWADPSRELSVALIVNSGLGTPFGDLRIARISAAAIACTDRRSGRSRSWVTAAARRPFRRPSADGSDAAATRASVA